MYFAGAAINFEFVTQLIRHSRPCAISLDRYQPLYKRVPKADERGRLLSDFMVLIPGMRDWPRSKLVDAMAGIQSVLGTFQEVVFADLNLHLNLLWVSVKPEPGIIAKVAARLTHRIPEAKVISAQFS